MNAYVRHGIYAAVALVVILGLLLLALAGPEPGPDTPQRWMRISVVTSCVLVLLISFGLWRSYRSGAIWLVGRTRALRFERATEPYFYWFWFAFYLLLIPLIVWMMIQRIHELKRSSSNYALQRTAGRSDV